MRGKFLKMPNTIIDTKNLSNQIYDYIIKSMIDVKLVFGQISNICKTAKVQFFRWFSFDQLLN